MSARKGIALAAIVGVMAGGLAVTVAFQPFLHDPSAEEAFGLNEVAANGNVQGRLYPGDPDFEAKLVESEEQRLVYVRTVASVARWSDLSTGGPYRLATGPVYTLVLPERAAPYTMSDLLALAPDSFVADGDGAYLLSESIAVLPGATLSLSATEPVELRLASGDSFVSIVSLGGNLSLAGTPSAPVTVTSWDERLGTADTDTTDGRAYIRVLGGTASISYAEFADLGFWSGNTGGLSLTGTDADLRFDAAEQAAGAEELPHVAGAEVLPPGQLGSLAAQSENYGFVSAGIDHASMTGNAFGLFVASAADVHITDTRISGSLVDGLVFHRAVTDSSVIDTSSSNNAVDGFTLARSSTGVTFTRVSATDNGRNGISLDGQPLADGPSAIGTAVENYGGNSVVDSTVSGNGRYGIEIMGGRDILVEGTTVAASEMGIVVDHAAHGVALNENTISDQARQGIAIRDGSTNAEVARNTVTGTPTGIYVRNSGALVTENQLGAVSLHGVTLVGDVDGSTVRDNLIAGTGTVPVFDEGASGATLLANDVADWHPAPTVKSVVGSIFQPLTIVWLVLGIVVVATALAPQRRRARVFEHPYANRAPLSSFTRGIVSRESIGGTQ